MLRLTVLVRLTLMKGARSVAGSVLIFWGPDMAFKVKVDTSRNPIIYLGIERDLRTDKGAAQTIVKPISSSITETCLEWITLNGQLATWEHKLSINPSHAVGEIVQKNGEWLISGLTNGGNFF